MPRRRARSCLLCACAAALSAGLAGCAGNFDVLENVGTNTAKSSSIFATPDWARANDPKHTVSLGPSGPVELENLVGADGSCAPAVAPAAENAQAAQPAPAATPVAAAAAPAAAAPPPPDRAVGSLAGDLAGPPMPAGPPPAPKPKRTKVAALTPAAEPLPGLQPDGPQVIGGIALGMTECDAVRRAGRPSNVSIGANEKGERKVVLTYLTGERPGIYTFDSGRLKEVDRAPEPPAPPPTAKKKIKKKIVKKKPAKSAQSNYERAYVQ